MEDLLSSYGLLIFLPVITLFIPVCAFLAMYPTPTGTALSGIESDNLGRGTPNTRFDWKDFCLKI